MQSIEIQVEENKIINFLEQIINFMGKNKIKSEEILIDSFEVKDYLKKIKFMTHS